MKVNFKSFKVLGLAVTSLMIGSAAVTAAPYYVGYNPTPENTVFLQFTDAPTDIAGSNGNIAAIRLEANYSFMQDLAARLDFPFYMASKGALGGADSEANIGNLNLGVNWNQTLSESTDAIRWGYMVSLDGYTPTARNSKAFAVATASPTLDFYRYSPYTTTLNPQVGFFVSQNYFSAKTNVGYAYSYISRPLTSTDKNRNNFNWQLAATYHPIPVLNINLEYNTFLRDKATRTGALGTSETRYLHALSPSVSGEFGPLVAAIFANIPLDEPTRDYSPVAFGLNAGYNF